MYIMPTHSGKKLNASLLLLLSSLFYMSMTTQYMYYELNMYIWSCPHVDIRGLLCMATCVHVRARHPCPYP